MRIGINFFAMVKKKKGGGSPPPFGIVTPGPCPDGDPKVDVGFIQFR
jgi:hypothetical protein